MITTIITTYRRPALLKRAVNSVLQQTHSHFQLIVYDNASDDETAKIMQDFIKKDSRVKYHRHPENIGMMANYQYAFDRIDTPYFSFLSDDDFLLPHFYETALKGFQDFPDAAFSACGILQMDVNGTLVGDPLSLWNSEGYFDTPTGLFEMLKTRWRFPVPTGVLFQKKVVKDIKPDFSPDIELYWDPDYLLRIAASHPIVINKKACGIYLAHSQSFANSFYVNLLNDVPSIEKYLKATSKVMQKIKSHSFLNTTNRRKTEKLFYDYIRSDSVAFIKNYAANQSLRGVHFLSKKFYLYFGLSPTIIFFHSAAILLKCLPFLKKIARALPKSKVDILPTIDLEELKNYHDYGQHLAKDS